MVFYSAVTNALLSPVRQLNILGGHPEKFLSFRRRLVLHRVPTTLCCLLLHNITRDGWHFSVVLHLDINFDSFVFFTTSVHLFFFFILPEIQTCKKKTFFRLCKEFCKSIHCACKLLSSNSGFIMVKSLKIATWDLQAGFKYEFHMSKNRIQRSKWHAMIAGPKGEGKKFWYQHFNMHTTAPAVSSFLPVPDDATQAKQIGHFLPIWPVTFSPVSISTSSAIIKDPWKSVLYLLHPSSCMLGTFQWLVQLEVPEGSRPALVRSPL